MDRELATTGGDLRPWLDQAVVLMNTVDQLRKDLDLPGLERPDVGPLAFEGLRAQVLAALERWSAGNSAAFSRAINRVDLTERTVDAAMERGGLHALAGVIVLRGLQKVLLRRHFAGRA